MLPVIDLTLDDDAVFALIPSRKRRKTQRLVVDLTLEDDEPPPPPVPRFVRELTCGCCFVEYIEEKMGCCYDGHFQCLECIRRYAEEQIGQRKTAISCICTATSKPCVQTIPESILRRALSSKSFDLWQRLQFEEQVTQMQLPGFETCPFCPFGAIMEVDQRENPLFFCLSQDCRKISCRKCKLEDHRPKTCEEAAMAEAGKETHHKVDEAMTEGLIRECSKCKRRFFKEDGCNKMNCQCGQIMCYVCRKPIKGYEHFKDRGGTGDCPLWDDSAKRNEVDVELAKKEIMAQLEKGAHVDNVNELIRKKLSAAPAQVPEGPVHHRPAVPQLPPPPQRAVVIPPIFLPLNDLGFAADPPQARIARRGRGRKRRART